MLQRSQAKLIWTFASGMAIGLLICCIVRPAQSQQVEGVRPVPIPTPSDPHDRDGLDPIEQRQMVDRQRIYALEQELKEIKELNQVQIRQIAQLQRYTFGIGQSGIGAIGAAGPDETPQPIGTPPEFMQEPKSDE